MKTGAIPAPLAHGQGGSTPRGVVATQTRSGAQSFAYLRRVRVGRPQRPRKENKNHV